MKMFKILSSDRKDLPKDFPTEVPWELVEPLRERCLHGHSQTLERLNERGGLGVGELYGHVNNIPYSQWWTFSVNDKYKKEILDWFYKWYSNESRN